MRILLVADHIKSAAFVRKGLKEAGYVVDHYINGNDGLSAAKLESYDAGVIDIMLPGIDGLTLIEDLRSSNINLPVIILSARRSVDDRVKGFNTGGDDYLTKPFAFSELLARLQALIRRANHIVEPNNLSFHDLTIDIRSKKVIRANRKINLQPLEFSLL